MKWGWGVEYQENQGQASQFCLESADYVFHEGKEDNFSSKLFLSSNSTSAKY